VIAASNICTSTLERADYIDKVKTGNAKIISGRKKSQVLLRPIFMLLQFGTS
jgi:hypothetical protein